MDAELRLADLVMVLSSFQARTYLEAGVDEDRLRILHLGVDTDLFSPSEHQSEPPCAVGFVGQITQRKGISYLLEAMDALPANFQSLMMVGRPVGRVRPWLRPWVSHLGPLPRWELPALYRKMGVFVMPSLIEGFALTALEAMACGVPVIVSENTFGSDVIQDGLNGFVVPIRSSGAIRERLLELLRDPELRLRMGAEARRTALSFTWEAYASNLIRMVDPYLDRSGGLIEDQACR